MNWGSSLDDNDMLTHDEWYAQFRPAVHFAPVKDAEVYITRNEDAEGIVAVDIRIPSTTNSNGVEISGQQYTVFYYEYHDHPIENVIHYKFGTNYPVVPVISLYTSNIPDYILPDSYYRPDPIGWIEVSRTRSDNKRIPYSYAINPHPTRWGTITVVAAPGVMVVLPEGDSQQQVVSSSLLNTEVQEYPPACRKSFPDLLPPCTVIRVWDPARVPRFGEPIDPNLYFQPIFFQPENSTHFVVRTPLSNGETITYFEGANDFQGQLKIQIPMQEYSEGYSIAIEYTAGPAAFYGFFDNTAICLYHSFNDTERQRYLTSEGHEDRIGSYTAWYHKRFRTFTDVPLSGGMGIMRRDEVTPLREAPPGYDDTLYGFSTFVVDLGVGFIPFVGDAVDWAEFSWVLTTGQDKWGNEVGPLEKVLMGVGCLLPFVGAAAMKNIGGEIIHGGAEAMYNIWRKSAPNFLRRGPATEMEAIEALLELQNGHRYLQAIAELDVSARKMHAFLKHAEAIQNGTYYSQHWRRGALGEFAEWGIDLLRKIWTKMDEIEDATSPRALINHAGDGFSDPVLQELYRANGGTNSPMKWLADAHRLPDVQGRLDTLFENFDVDLFFPQTADDFFAALGRSGAPPTSWGHEWPTNLGDDIVEGVTWKPPMPINMPTARTNRNGNIVLEHTDWTVIRGRAWQNFAFYNLTRQAGVPFDSGFDEAIDAVRRWGADHGDELIPNVRLGREFPVNQLLGILDDARAPALPHLNLSTNNLSRAQALELVRKNVTIDPSAAQDQLAAVWSALGQFSLKRNSAITGILRRNNIPVTSANIKSVCEMALGKRQTPTTFHQAVTELLARRDTYLGGRGRLRHTKVGELMKAAADGAQIPVRSVLEIDHGVRQEAHRISELLLGEDQAGMVARLTQVGNPFNLDPVTPGAHMLQDAHRIAFSSFDAFDHELKRAAREIEDQFLRPFANMPDDELSTLITSLKAQMVNGQMPLRLRSITDSKQRQKLLKGIWHLNNEILLRGMSEALLPGLGKAH